MEIFEISIFLVLHFFLLVHPSIILWLILKIKINEISRNINSRTLAWFNVWFSVEL